MILSSRLRPSAVSERTNISSILNYRRAFRRAINTSNDQQKFRHRLKTALGRTKVEWYWVSPIGLGAAWVAYSQGKKWIENNQKREYSNDAYQKSKPARGPWQFYVLSTLPLRPLSRLWGKFNEITLPVWFRPYGFRFYAWVFGANLDEMKDPDLTHYSCLGEFFLREIDPNVRKIDYDAPLVSPADGKVVSVGVVKGRDIDQVKGMTYSLDALLGPSQLQEKASKITFDPSDLQDDEKFAELNGINYSLKELMGNTKDQQKDSKIKTKDATDKEDESSVSDIITVGSEVAYDHGGGQSLKEGNALFYAVVYLAPGDYHRFHSPANWVAEGRRHFAGDLFSVNPYIVKRLRDLFVLNERVVVFGRWRYGFFSMTPVGATNVGSIRINFDKDLKTNAMYKDKPKGSFEEASYAASSSILGGKPLRTGEQMGGFSLGSTIVLVFEAPKTYNFIVEEGQQVKVGEPLMRSE